MSDVTRSTSKPPPSVSAPVITSTLSPAYSPQSGKGNQGRCPKYSNVRTYYDDHDIFRTCHQLVDKQTHTPTPAQADIRYADQSQSTSHVSTGNRKTTSQHAIKRSGIPASALNVPESHYCHGCVHCHLYQSTHHSGRDLCAYAWAPRVTSKSTGDPHYGSHPHLARSTGDCAHGYLHTGASTGDELVCPTTKDVGPTAPRPHHELPKFMQNIQYPHCETVSSPPHRSAWSDEGAVGLRHLEPLSWAVHPPHPHRPHPLPPGRSLLACFLQEAARLYDVTRSASSVNHEGPRQYIPTDLVVNQWDTRATGHPDDNWILDAIR